jgi:hypothetical protein
MNHIFEKVNVYDSVFIFGCSDIGEAVFEKLLPVLQPDALYFCDNNKYKVDHARIFSVNEAVEKFYEEGRTVFILASNLHICSMTNQLLALGVFENDIVKEVPAEITHKTEEQKACSRLSARDRLHQFDCHIVSHCNLNCASCNVFSPLAEHNFLDISVFDKDMKRMSQLFNGEAGRVHILGGEPLLHRGIGEFLISARNSFHKATVAILTNGILLQSMPVDFWKVCGENSIQIVITKYPIHLDYDKIESIAQSFGAAVEYFGNALDMKYSYCLPLDLLGTQDPQDSFRHCIFANQCFTLKEGRMFTCSTAPNVKYFNTHFNERLELCDRDSVDIYKAQDNREILDFLSKPIPFCRYCNVQARRFDDAWRRSKKEIGEWALETGC